MNTYSEKLLKNLQSHISAMQDKIRSKFKEVKIVATTSLAALGKMDPSSQKVFMDLRAHAQTRVEELEQLESSPYFMKCEIIDEKGVSKKYFFAKYEFSEESIFSWVSPIAAMRFEEPGMTSYRLPDGTVRSLKIESKEQYMIVDGKVLFFAREALDVPRELIYQEHFTKQKTDFALPEIVAQMEKAQDQVIRASHKGPLIISGPAGSGKTTLALHRVAYLTQAPDTAGLYQTHSIIVFVQDTGTKDYFSTLLPGLGIHNVQITTFFEWACSILDITDYTYSSRYGQTEIEKDLYEYHKLRALRENGHAVWGKNIFTVLERIYERSFSKEIKKIFDHQKKEKVLDRFDLTLLLEMYLKKYGKFEVQKSYFTYVKDSRVQKTIKTAIEYSLIVVDEFQNYLPEQLALFKACLSEQTKAIIYVGDSAQQVKLGTKSNLNVVGEIVTPERNIRLHKVYRNTQNILKYIESVGFAVDIPAGLKEGPAVLEHILQSSVEEIDYIVKLVPIYKQGSIGILAVDDVYLESFKNAFAAHKNVHVMTMLESQGVEFDLVCIVGVTNELFAVSGYADLPADFLAEKKRIQRDLLYVGLTRAITELHILGSGKLRL